MAEGRRVRLAGLLAAATAVATRWPFAARRLWDHDSVQFALGVERYDLAAHHPHPPGYPLYIALLKGLAALGVDSLHGMVALSILAAALGAGLIVPLTAGLVAAGHAGPSAGPGRLRLGAGAPLAAGVLAAALYVFNPLLWFYAELPLVYAVEGGMSVALAYAALRMPDGGFPFVAGCGAFALAGGIRPSTLVLLLPLFLLGAWRAWRRGLRPGTLLAGAAAALGLGLAWLLPLLAAAGGLAAYRRIGQEHFSTLLPYTSILYGAGWPALAHNLIIMTKWFLQGLVPATVALAGLWLAAARRRGGAARATLGDGLRVLAASAPLLAAWVVPPVLFFALFHITKAGYTLVYLPALLVAASLLAAPALGAEPAGESAGPPGEPAESAGQPGEFAGPFGGAAVSLGKAAVPPGGAAASSHRPAGRAVAAILLATATGAGLFIFGADRRPDQPRALAVVCNEFNRAAIATYERDLDRLLGILRQFPPANTVLATVELSGTGPGGPESFLYPWQRHLQWYLPDYEVLHLVPEERFALVTRGHHPFQRAGPTLLLPAATGQIAIVLSGPTGDRFPLARWPLRRIGDTFYLVVVPLSDHLRLGPFDFETHARRAA